MHRGVDDGVPSIHRFGPMPDDLHRGTARDVRSFEVAYAGPSHVVKQFPWISRPRARRFPLLTHGPNAGAIRVVKHVRRNDPSMWIGDFVSRRDTLVSNHECWESMPIRAGYPGVNGIPNPDDILSAIASGTWATPQADAFNLAGFYWGGIQGVSPNARHIWVDPFFSSNVPYAVFRAPVSALSGCK